MEQEKIPDLVLKKTRILILNLSKIYIHYPYTFFNYQCFMNKNFFIITCWLIKYKARSFIRSDPGLILREGLLRIWSILTLTSLSSSVKPTYLAFELESSRVSTFANSARFILQIFFIFFYLDMFLHRYEVLYSECRSLNRTP